MLRGLRAGAGVALGAGLAVAVLAAPSQAALKHYDGNVLKAKQDSFRIKTESGNKLTFAVDGQTEFERIAGGLAGLERGLRVEVDAKRAGGSLLARQVERKRNNGGGHGGGGGNDDPPGHG